MARYKLEVEFEADNDAEAVEESQDALLEFGSIVSDRLTNDAGEEVSE